MESNLALQQDVQCESADAMPAPAALAQNLAEVDILLMEHARQSTALATVATGIKSDWLAFIEQAPAKYVPAALQVAAQVGRIRGELVAETLRVAEILHGVGSASTTVNVGQAAVLVAPRVRRRGQAK